jgi:hypothetical protein
VKITCDSRLRGLLSVDETARELPDAVVARSERSVACAIDFLGAAPARVLSHQPTDEKSLEDQERECGQDVPVVQLPDCWVFELDDGAGREARGIDIPPPQLAPIEGGHQLLVLNRNVLRALAAEDLQRKFGRACSERLRAPNGAANDTLTHVRGLRSVDWHWRRLSNGARHCSREDDVAGILLGIADIEHDASWGSPPDCRSQPRNRGFVDIHELGGRQCRQRSLDPIPKVG